MDRYIKSPLNYIGGKYKILDQILPLFPKSGDTFVDLFGGGFNVGINVKGFDNIIYNDSSGYVANMLYFFKSFPYEFILDGIDYYIKKYDLTKTNKEGYLNLRNDYNNGNGGISDPLMLYTLMCYSFNNQIRFNSKGKFNMPFGLRSFNPTLKNRLVEFIIELEHKIQYMIYCVIHHMRDI